MKPIEKTSVTDAVVANLKELITSGEIPIDEKLPTEKEICEQLNVGRSTVREALRVLQAMGYVKMIPGRGAFVAKIKDDDQASIKDWFMENKLQITDFMEVRLAIETLAVRLAIERATDEEIENIEEIQIEFEKAMHNNEISKLALCDEAIHSNIIKATHNNLLIAINQKMDEAFREYRTKSFAVKGNASNALLPHREIINALKKRDVNMGVDAVSKHIDISIKDISAVVEQTLE